MSQSTTAYYQLPAWTGLLRHGWGDIALVRDGSDQSEPDLQLQARVRSGDYFMTLATELEEVANSLQAVEPAEAAELERLVAELIAVNRYFVITKK